MMPNWIARPDQLGVSETACRGIAGLSRHPRPRVLLYDAPVGLTRPALLGLSDDVPVRSRSYSQHR